MKACGLSEEKQQLNILCTTVKHLVQEKKYDQCEPLLAEAAGRFYYAPEPHNLLGILLETEGDHVTAMKHFRAAWALDPAYIPARYNMEHCGSLSEEYGCAYVEEDCAPDDKKNLYKTEYDHKGIGHMVRRYIYKAV